MADYTQHTSRMFKFIPVNFTSSQPSRQKSTNNLERDETYIPPTRKDFKLPDGKIAVRMDYTEVLEETPAFTLFKMFVRQFL